MGKTTLLRARVDIGRKKRAEKILGRYGLTPVWEDGHHTGIFTYEKLRASCECQECSDKRYYGR